MTISPARILTHYLTFRPRAESGYVRFPAGAGLASPVGPLGEPFQELLAGLWRSYRRDDLREMTRQAFAGHGGLRDWYIACLRYAGIDIVFRDAAPRIGAGGFTAWRDLTCRLDPDALLTAAFTLHCGRMPQQADLCRWGVHALYDSRELDRICAEGISDIHVHLGGCEPVSLLWLEVMWGRIRPEQLPQYQPKRLDALARQTVPSPLLDELRWDLAAIAKARHWAQDWLGPRPPTLDCDPDPFPSPLAKALWIERKMLCRHWLSGSDDDLRALDLFLFAKNRFLARHQQFPGGNPGLDNFRDYFDRPKPVAPLHSVRVEHERYLRQIATCTENPRMHRIEFRIGPSNSVGSYARFFRDWEKHFARSRYLVSRKDLIRFVIHFVRRPGGDDDGEAVPHARLRRIIDQQSAALHLFRLKYHGKREALHRHICGIDVASVERQCPVDVFSPYLRMLRGIFSRPGGEPAVLDHATIRSELTSDYASHWRRILDEGKFIAPALPRLGLTYHAGEDFFHPLDGMRSIGNAIEFCRMQPGDRIGHGLAAGTGIRAFTERYGRSILIPRGEILDSLAWLHRMLSRLPGHDAALRSIETELDDLAQQLFGRTVSVHDINRLKRRRHNFPDRPDNQVRDLWELENSADVRRRRKCQVQLPSIYDCLVEPIHRAQQALVGQAAERNVVFEINPSSNLATSHLDSLRDHPMFLIRDHAQAEGRTLRITINSDDPGTFATRLENEYALMVEAMQGRCDAPYALIQEMIRWARESGFGTDLAA